MLNDYFRDIRKLTAQLFANGRSFRIVRNSVKEKIFNALSISEGFFVKDADSILDHILPDNPNFTVYDALLWEARLGINSNMATDLEDRKAAIIQKLNHPGNVIARQSGDFIQKQLQIAGFNVWVHDNVPAQSIQQVLNNYYNLPQWGNFQFGQVQFGNVYSVYGDLFTIPQWGNFQFGQQQFGQKKYKNIVANKISRVQDTGFLWQNINRTFFIGGQELGEFASVPQNREEEFRQLVLQLKPARTIAILLINYT